MGLHRREVLATFLGLPAALAACRAPRRPLPPGELLHRSEVLGHRVRDGAAIEVPAAAWTSVPILIVGGGVAGLSAAWRLARAGVREFELFELDPVAGGTAKGDRGAWVPHPWGAHYVTVPMASNRALLTLLRELGVVVGIDDEGEPVVPEEQLCRDPAERLFVGDKWIEGLWPRTIATAEDDAELRAFRGEVDAWVRFRDGRGRRAFALPVAHGSDDAEVTALDRLSMASWLDARGLRSPVLRWFLEYACRDDYGATLDQTSAWAALFYFAARLRTPGDAPQGIVTWPEGNARLVAGLHARVAEQTRLGVAVAELVPRDDGTVDAVCLRADGSAFGVHAGRVVFAAPQFVAARVIRPWRDARPAHLDAFTYGAWMVANLSVRGRPRSRGLPFAWDSVLHDSPSLGYVEASHQRGVDHGPTVLTYYHPLCDADPNAARRRLLSAGRDEWADVALTDLSRAHPDLAALTERLDVVRWGHAMIRPAPGFAFGGARQAAAQPYRSIHFAHTELSGVALFEEAFFHGVRAAEEILVARGVALGAWP